MKSALLRLNLRAKSDSNDSNDSNDSYLYVRRSQFRKKSRVARNALERRKMKQQKQQQQDTEKQQHRVSDDANENGTSLEDHVAPSGGSSSEQQQPLTVEAVTMALAEADFAVLQNDK